MKVIKSKGGYFYKIYKNGKKKRISKIEYNKLIKNPKQKGGMGCSWCWVWTGACKEWCWKNHKDLFSQSEGSGKPIKFIFGIKLFTQPENAKQSEELREEIEYLTNTNKNYLEKLLEEYTKSTSGIGTSFLSIKPFLYKDMKYLIEMYLENSKLFEEIFGITKTELYKSYYEKLGVSFSENGSSSTNLPNKTDLVKLYKMILNQMPFNYIFAVSQHIIKNNKQLYNNKDINEYVKKIKRNYKNENYNVLKFDPLPCIYCSSKYIILIAVIETNDPESNIKDKICLFACVFDFSDSNSLTDYTTITVKAYLNLNKVYEMNLEDFLKLVFPINDILRDLPPEQKLRMEIISLCDQIKKKTKQILKGVASTKIKEDFQKLIQELIQKLNAKSKMGFLNSKIPFHKGYKNYANMLKKPEIQNMLKKTEIQNITQISSTIIPILDKIIQKIQKGKNKNPGFVDAKALALTQFGINVVRMKAYNICFYLNKKYKINSLSDLDPELYKKRMEESYE